MTGDKVRLRNYKPAMGNIVMRIIALILLVFFASDTARAAITKLLKKRKVVVIDDGDVSKGDKVCFYSASGRKRACGKVVKVKEDKSYVRVKSKKRFRRLKKGMAHEVNPSSGSGSKMRSGHSFVLRLLYTPGFKGRSQFEYIDSSKERGGNDGHFVSLSDSTITENDSAASKAARMFPWASGGLEGEIFFTATMSLAMGGRYTHLNLSPRVIHNFLIEADPEHLLSRYTGHELGFWLDFFPLHVADLGLKLGIGGEFTMSNISIETDRMIDETLSDGSVTKKVQNPPEAFKGKSSANIISVRLSARKDFPMGDYGIGLGVTGIISPTAISSAFTLDGDPHDSILNPYSDVRGGGNDKEKMIKDLEKALDHTNNMLSIVFGLSVYFGI